jgi:hypothetical protein
MTYPRRAACTKGLGSRVYRLALDPQPSTLDPRPSTYFCLVVLFWRIRQNRHRALPPVQRPGPVSQPSDPALQGTLLAAEDQESASQRPDRVAQGILPPTPDPESTANLSDPFAKPFRSRATPSRFFAKPLRSVGNLRDSGSPRTLPASPGPKSGLHSTLPALSRTESSLHRRDPPARRTVHPLPEGVSLAQKSLTGSPQSQISISAPSCSDFRGATERVGTPDASPSSRPSSHRDTRGEINSRIAGGPVAVRSSKECA